MPLLYCQHDSSQLRIYQKFNEMTFIPVLSQKMQEFDIKITFLSGLSAEIAILFFVACWSNVHEGTPVQNSQQTTTKF